MADAPLHILIIDVDRIRASIIEDGPREVGQARVTVLVETSELVRRVVEIEPDVIFIGLENPNRDVVEYMFQVSRAVKRPVAMSGRRRGKRASHLGLSDVGTPPLH